MRFRKRARNTTDEELNITAFLNLMVVLIPFLLLNAVFAQVAVLNLNLPAEQATPPEEDQEKKLALEVLIYGDRYEVADRTSGSVLSVVENKGEQHDRDALNDYLVKVKQKFPDITSITLLCEEDTPYELLIHTMDTVRFRTEMINGEAIRKDLFPDISIGSAPPDTTEEAATGGAA